MSWRSLYCSDPEENSVEFVCSDPAVEDKTADVGKTDETGTTDEP